MSNQVPPRARGTDDTGWRRARTSRNRALFALIAVIVGLSAVVGAFWLALWLGRAGGNQLAYFGAAASPIVAIVSAYFGIQATAHSAEDAHSTSQGLTQKLRGDASSGDGAAGG